MMNQLRKYLGVLWMLLGLSVFPLAVIRAAHEIGEKPTPDNWIFWSIVIVVLLPIVAGSLILFGIYSLKEEYSR